jgi:prepilin-type N-terminal cleavage/methylation domain-containing protein
MHHNSSTTTNSRFAFTLIELLVVIAIIAILSVVVILTLNPAELLRQSRDSSRLSDMATMNTALGIYAEDTGGSMGTPSTTYISIFDPTATSTAGDQCQGLALPAQSTSSGWNYQCAASSSYRNVNGTGWIPLNFTTIASGAPIGSLPQDPLNQTSSNLFYTYTTDGKTYEVTSVMESSKYRSQLNANPSQMLYPGIAAVGTNLALSGLWNPNGLVGYWNFEEGSGSSTIDQSGNGNTGSWHGIATGTSGYYSAGKVGPWAGTFDGSTDYVQIPNASSLTGMSQITMSAWVYRIGDGSAVGRGIVVSKDANYLEGAGPGGGANGQVCASLFLNGVQYWQCFGGYSGANGSWRHIAVTYDGATEIMYLNGQSVYAHTWNQTLITGTTTLRIGQFTGGGAGFNGLIDDVRLYNRALSAAEIQAIYNAQK